MTDITQPVRETLEPENHYFLSKYNHKQFNYMQVKS